jgi:hypothetical protein
MHILDISLLLDFKICMHADIRGAMDEIGSYHELFPFFLVLVGYATFGLSLAFPFCLPCDGSGHRSSIGF